MRSVERNEKKMGFYGRGRREGFSVVCLVNSSEKPKMKKKEALLKKKPFY